MMGFRSVRLRLLLATLIYTFAEIAACPSMCTCDYYASVHTINCDSQDLTEMPDGIPEWSTQLSLDGNYLSTFDLAAFNTTVYFEEFSIRYSEMREIIVDNQTSSGKKGMRGACNRVSKIFPRLARVNLRGNLLKKLPKCLLSAWPVLKVLNLDQNHFKRMKDLNVADHVTYYDSLVELSMRRNQISKLTRQELYTPSMGMRSLKVLDLGENRISHIDAPVFMFMRELVDIRLHDNQIQSIPAYAFLTSGRKVESIQLQQNHISFISSLTFAGLPQLARLDLSDNIIRCLRPTSISTCPPALPQLSSRRRESERLEIERSLGFRANLDLSSLTRLRIRGNRWRCDCALNALLQDETMQRIASPTLNRLPCETPSPLRNMYLPIAMRSLSDCET